MWKKQDNKKDAYMTTEASLVLPLIIILIVFLMFLAFYLYSVCFLNQAAYIAALRGSLTMGEDAEEKASKELDELLEGRVLAIGGIRKEVTASALFVEVKLETVVELPFTGILPIESSIWNIEVKKRAAIRNAAGYIRILRQAAA